MDIIDLIYAGIINTGVKIDGMKMGKGKNKFRDE